MLIKQALIIEEERPLLILFSEHHDSTFLLFSNALFHPIFHRLLKHLTFHVEHIELTGTHLGGKPVYVPRGT